MAALPWAARPSWATSNLNLPIHGGYLGMLPTFYSGLLGNPKFYSGLLGNPSYILKSYIKTTTFRLGILPTSKFVYTSRCVRVILAQGPC